MTLDRPHSDTLCADLSIWVFLAQISGSHLLLYRRFAGRFPFTTVYQLCVSTPSPGYDSNHRLIWGWERVAGVYPTRWTAPSKKSRPKTSMQSVLSTDSTCWVQVYLCTCFYISFKRIFIFPICQWFYLLVLIKKYSYHCKFLYTKNYYFFMSKKCLIVLTTSHYRRALFFVPFVHPSLLLHHCFVAKIIYGLLFFHPSALRIPLSRIISASNVKVEGLSVEEGYLWWHKQCYFIPNVLCVCVYVP